jgi:serine/threonine protein kinase
MPSLEQGRHLADRYVLQRCIGDGGHAGIWVALDEQSGSQVALKFLHEGACRESDIWQALAHEAEMSRRVAHPAVVQVDGPVRCAEGVFLSLEYVSGSDAAPLRGESWRRLLPVLQQLADVLSHAHACGVVHRDIKSGNVLIDQQSRVRLVDFGAAAALGSTWSMTTGSPFSASPQQLRGEPAEATDDVYGLGAFAYELLSGCPPFYPDFDAQVMSVQMPAELRPVRPAPQELLALVTQMLARDAAARPQSMVEVGQSLARMESLSDGVAAKPRVRARWWFAGAALLALSVLWMLSPSTPVVAPEVVLQITSDNVTTVSIAKVGELGKFASYELPLAPGRYTVLGRRQGFRDVRHDLYIAPDQHGAMLTVQCTERI